MAHFGKDLDDFKGSRCVHIRSAEQNDHFTVYIITLTVGPYSWTVKHRYSEFHDLHEKLTASHKLDKTLLPPKKMFGNQTESFIKKRQRELEIYLQTIMLYLAQHIPSCLAFFLDFDSYEIHGITQAMAEDLYNRGESLLQSREKYEVSTLQLYSLTERLKLPEPTCDSGDVKKDLGHILDFITRAKHLKINSSNAPVGSSNIVMSKLQFDLTLFKSLQTLEMNGCNFRLVSGLETVKQTLMRFSVHESSSSLKELLLQDSPHWRAEDGSVIVGPWEFTTHLDFSRNSFSEIPESIQLMPNTEELNLSHNMIDSIQNLQWLSQLTHLDLSYNNIRHVDSLHTKMGNVKKVRLAHNHLESLHGFAKLFSLQTLDVSYNKISSIEEVAHVSHLPCVENLHLVGNVVTTSLDYRTKTLVMFGDRVREVILDGAHPDQKELDTVAVLQALRKAKDVKISKRPQPRKTASAVSLSEVYSQTPPGSLTDQLEGRDSSNASPAPAAVSQSVPVAASEFMTREMDRANASHSPFSQESVSSYCSAQEGEPPAVELIPEAHPFDLALPAAPRSLGLTAAAISADNSNGNDCNNSSGIPYQLIPEAHPYDLSVENPASASPQSSRLSRGSIDSGKELDQGLVDKGLGLVHDESRVLHPRSVGTEKRRGSSASSDSASLKNVLPDQLSDVSQKRKVSVTYNAADLPTTSDSGFVLWLQEQLLTSSVWGEGRLEKFPDTSNADSDAIVDVLWCYAEQFSQKGVLFPCCAVLSKDKVFIERLVGLESKFASVPELEPCSVIPLKNVQQMVVGPCHSFFRLEEAFVGRPGTFTLFAIEPLGLRKFVNKFFEVCQDLDVPNSPDCIDLSIQSDLLKEIVSREEKLCRMTSDRLAAAIVVKRRESTDFNLLVLSENRVYCLDLACVHWPPVSFDTSPDTTICVNSLHEFSIIDQIRDIKTQPESSTTVAEAMRENASASKKFSIPEQAQVSFGQYDLSLEVVLSPDPQEPSVSDPVARSPSSCVGYSFSSLAHRDTFLDRLTNLRAEQANQMASSMREEPEGGNEQLPLTDGRVKSGSGRSTESLKVSSISHVDSASSIHSGVGLDKASDFDNKQSSQHIKQLPAASTSDDVKSSEVQLSESNFLSSSSTKSDKTSNVKSGVSDSQANRAFRNSTTDNNIHGDNSGLVNVDTTDCSGSISVSPQAGEDMSVSPMSNFSRASISPPLEPGAQADGRGPSQVIISQATVAKADSLPSSFEWKKFYFRAPPTQGSDVQEIRNFTGTLPLNKQESSVGDSGFKVNMSLPQSDTEQNTETPVSRGGRILEDIESSSEFEPRSRKDSESEADIYLKQCIKAFDLIHPLPTKLKPLRLMNGPELRKFFHSSIAAASPATDSCDRLSEELHYILWVNVVPYTNPKQEITTLVMLSTTSIYLVSDTDGKVSQASRPSWMTHSRNQSDSAFAWKTEAGLVDSRLTTSRKTVKPYFVFKLKDIHQVNIGMFDQCVRLTGSNENAVFTLMTRDSVVTETFLQKVKQALSLSISSPMLERNRAEIEQDFYRDFSQRTKTTVEGHVYTHPSQVSFVYPGDDAVHDMLYLVNEKLRQRSPSSSGPPSSLWLYLQCYLLPSDDSGSPETAQPRSIILTSTHFCLAEEDIVTYPLPDFVRGMPENPCHEVVECRSIECLKRITLYHTNPHWTSLTFSDEKEAIEVDISMEHFASARPASAGGRQRKPSPELTFRLFIQSVKERDRLIQVLGRLWKQAVPQVGRILDVHTV